MARLEWSRLTVDLVVDGDGCDSLSNRRALFRNGGRVLGS